MPEESESNLIADPDSVLGQLQRGRGVGFLAALELPTKEAHELITRCVLHDPRLDKQVESRSEYYAELILTTKMNLEPLEAHLRSPVDPNGNWWKTNLALMVIYDLAKVDYRDAVRIGRDYIRYGEDWYSLLESLQLSDNSTAFEGIGGIISERFPSESELAEALRWHSPEDEPWKTLIRENERIARVFNGHASVHSPQAQVCYDACSVEELLRDACNDRFWLARKALEQKVQASDFELLLSHLQIEKPPSSFLALCGLSKIGDKQVYKIVLDLIEHHEKLPPLVRRGLAITLERLSPILTLEKGRSWFDAADQQLRWFGEIILEKHATSDDIPQLCQAISSGLKDEEENCYRICQCIDAFHHLPNIGAVPEIEAAFETARYSYARIRSAKALLVTNRKQFEDRYALESLWDCEDEIKELGIETVALTEISQRRLHKLATDRLYDEHVGKAAKNRMKGAQ